jgi:hypothetical protein
MSPHLKVLLDQVFPSLDGRVHVGADCPDDYEVVESYAVVPSLQRPRFVLPLSSRRAARQVLVSYNALRPMRVRLERRALATGLSVLAPRRVGTVINVCVRRGSQHHLEDLLISAHLASVLGSPVVGLAFGVRAPGPNSKPTLLCVRPSGELTGFAKVGWNPVTRHLVATEAHALRQIKASALSLSVPALLAETSWCDRALTVTAPLPADVEHWPDDREAPNITETLAVSTIGPTSRQPLDSSRQVTALRSRTNDTWDPEVRQAFDALIDAMCTAVGNAVVDFGSWHGDWSPWNVATSGGRLVVWDWEHFNDHIAVGLDLVNWHFRVALNLDGLPVGAALGRARERSAASLVSLATSAELDEICTSLLALELTARYEEMAAAGAGRSEPFHVGLVAAMRTLEGRWRGHSRS